MLDNAILNMIISTTDTVNKKGILDMDKIKIVKDAGELFKIMDTFNNGVGTFVKYITNPILLFKAFASVSYEIGLAAGMTGIILYVIGYKKGGRIATVSVVGYTIIQAINCVV